MEKTKFNRSRRNFLANAGVLAIGSTLPIDILADHPFKKKEPIIDIHQHIHYMS
ncbi:MAG: amidohydrolase, partial [Bacteroidetes bacterium]|nr:amidohydrolase [Bacteroidota bacterium]